MYLLMLQKMSAAKNSNKKHNCYCKTRKLISHVDFNNSSLDHLERYFEKKWTPEQEITIKATGKKIFDSRMQT